MAEFRALSETFSVSPQIRVEDVAQAAASGVRVIVMNRPDGEEPGQPATADIETAATAAGLKFVRIPIRGGPPPEAVAETAALLASAEGPVLAFCRSGTRSATLWAYAQAKAGADPQALLAAAQRAGYDLSAHAGALQALAQAAKA